MLLLHLLLIHHIWSLLLLHHTHLLPCHELLLILLITEKWWCLLIGRPVHRILICIEVEELLILLLLHWHSCVELRHLLGHEARVPRQLEVVGMAEYGLHSIGLDSCLLLLLVSQNGHFLIFRGQKCCWILLVDRGTRLLSRSQHGPRSLLLGIAVLLGRVRAEQIDQVDFILAFLDGHCSKSSVFSRRKVAVVSLLWHWAVGGADGFSSFGQLEVELLYILLIFARVAF